MGAGISLVGDMETAGLLVFTGANIVVFTQLLGTSINYFLTSQQPGNTAQPKSEPQNETNAFYDARMRVSAFFTIAVVVAIAAALQLTLKEGLANQIIAAYFVGQGFALQSFVQSYLCGIQIRSNKSVWHNMLNGQLSDGKNIWTISQPHSTVFLLALTLTQSASATPKKRADQKLVVWTELLGMTVINE